MHAAVDCDVVQDAAEDVAEDVGEDKGSTALDDQLSEADEARLERLQQGGIAPDPTILFPRPDDPDTCEGPQCSPPPLMCIGVECRDPLFPNNPVRTLWTQDGIQ